MNSCLDEGNGYICVWKKDIGVVYVDGLRERYYDGMVILLCWFRKVDTKV